MTWRRAAGSVVCLGFLFGVLACSSSVDPAPPDYLVGLSREGDGTLRVWMGNCDGGAARWIAVSQTDPTNPPFWEVAGSGDGGVQVERAVPTDVVVGEPPSGMTTRMWSPDKVAETSDLSVSVNFTDIPSASVGTEADLSGVPDGEIVSHDNRYTPDEFSQELRDRCS